MEMNMESNLLFAGTTIQFSENELAKLENALENDYMTDGEMESNFLNYASETDTNESETGGNIDSEYEREYQDEPLKSTLESVLESEVLSTNNEQQDQENTIVAAASVSVAAVVAAATTPKDISIDEKRDTSMSMLPLSLSLPSSSASSPTSTSISTSRLLFDADVAFGYPLVIFNSEEMEIYNRRGGVEESKESKEDVIVDLLGLLRSSPIRFLVFFFILLAMVFDRRHHHHHHHYYHCVSSSSSSSSRSFCEPFNAVPTCPSNNCVQLFVTRVEHWKTPRQQHPVCNNPNVNMFEFFPTSEQQQTTEIAETTAAIEPPRAREQTLCRHDRMFEYRNYYHISHPLPFEMILNPHPIFLLCAMHF